MGDVVGHGVDAAKLTALARYTIRTEAAHSDATPSEVLTRLHQALIAQHRHTKMITVALCTLRPGTQRVRGTLCRAGHEPPLIRRASGRIDVLSTGGRILGATDDVVLHDTAFTLDSGDVLLLYTDGVTEARAGRGDPLFGDDRLADALARCQDLHADEILDHILYAVTEHSCGYRPDDTAVMVIRAD
jgi:serine phosphatase RsbU (regulator of sigma subunit)